MRRLVERLEGIVEGRQAGLGTFGGKHHTWPEEPMEWEIHDVDDCDKWDDCTSRTYQCTADSDCNFAFVEFDAKAWFESEFKKPVAVKMTITGTPYKSWTIPSLTKKEMAKAFKKAEKFAKKALTDELAKMPKIQGWEMGRLGDDVYYSKELGGKYSEASVYVHFNELTEALLNGEDAPGHMRFTAGADYEGSFGVKEQHFTWSKLSDVKKFVAKADKMATKEYETKWK